MIWEAAGYIPNPQELGAHVDPSRFKLVAGGERAGKSLWSAMELLCWLALISQGGLFWIVGPDYQLARPEFKHLTDAAQQISDLLRPGDISMPAQGPCKFTTPGGTIVETKTSAEVVKLAGFAPNGLLMVEAAQQGYDCYLQCRGRVGEKRGPLVLSGTFEGSFGWYPDLFNAWQGQNVDGGRSFSIPTWTNTAIYPGGRDDPEIKALEATYPADRFLERFAAVPCPPATLVFKEFSHVTHVQECYDEWKKAESLQVWIDPGYYGAYAVELAALRGGQVFICDEIYAHGRVAQDIIKEVKEREWWPKVRGGVIDVAGEQHHAQESQIEIWARLARLRLRSQFVPIPDGILRHRTFLKDPTNGLPRIFHDPRCKGIIREHGLYKYKEVVEGRPTSEDPIDADNHALKAVTYGLVDNFGFVAPARLPRVESHVRKR